MRKWLFISWLSICSTSISNAQVTEMWSSGLTNGWITDPVTTSNVLVTYYYGTTATVDGQGNTIVGGLITRFNLGSSEPFLAKFDFRGRKLWECETNGWPNPDGLAVDPSGNILLYGTIWSNQFYAVIAKLTPWGEELWRVSQPCSQETPFYATSVAMEQDPQGSAFFFVHTSSSQRSLSKISASGQVLWQRYFPRKEYVDADPGFIKSLSVTSDGGAATAGGYVTPSNYVAFVTKYDANGNEVWWSEDYTGQEEPYFYTSVVAGRRGTICAAATVRFATTFSSRGRALDTDGTIAGQLVAATDDGGFLLRNAGFLYELNPCGVLQWTADLGAVEDIIGVVPDGRGGWLAAGQNGGESSALLFIGIDPQGRQQWETSFGNYPYQPDFWIHEYNRVLRAPDGTFRVVVTMPYSYPGGIAVVSVGLNRQCHRRPDPFRFRD